MKTATAKPVATDVLPIEFRAGIIQYCTSNFPYESCGFILKDVDIDGVIHPFVNQAIANIHSNPKHAFKMQESEQLMIMTKYRDEIIGVYHSHPSGAPWPSTEDHAGVIDGLAENWHYWIVTEGAIFEYNWALSDDGISALQS